MRSIWRSVLTWLLVLAMPVQGIAAGGMQHCASAHERMEPGAMVSPVLQEHGFGHAHGAGQERRSVAFAADAAPAAASEAAVDGLAHTTVAASAGVNEDARCSACAACCPALGLLNRALDLPAAPSGSRLAPLPVAAVPAFVSARLDRPPRSFLG